MEIVSLKSRKCEFLTDICSVCGENFFPIGSEKTCSSACEQRGGKPQSAQSAFASGSHWVRPVERKFNVHNDWSLVPLSPTAKRPLEAREAVARVSAQDLRPATIACATCGEQFVPKRSDAKTCSSRCRQAAYHQRKRTAEAQQ
jgi:predicted nucleic acid-binding Zn ribbon protein